MKHKTKTEIPSCWFRSKAGSFGFLRYIKRRDRVAIYHLLPDGSLVRGGELSLHRIVNMLRRGWLRRLKNRPARARLRAAGW